MFPATKMSECHICFENVNKVITCDVCHIRICIDCLDSYLDSLHEQKQLPRCCGQNCRQYYLFSMLKFYPELHDKYYACCLDGLLQIYGDSSRKKWEVQQSVQRIREIKRVYIEEKFPLAISYTAQVIMPQRLQRLNKQLLRKMEQVTQETKRICMNLTCSGSLNAELKCLLCQTQFCPTCEKKLTPHHSCNEADIETLRFIREMIHCPKCHTAIEKSEGCNDMTCTRCHTNFVYNTGESGGSGNAHNAALEQENNALSFLYRDYLRQITLYDQFLTFEALIPAIPDNKPLIKILSHTYQEEVKIPKMLVQLSTAFERFILTSLKYEKYQRACQELEEHCQRQTLTIQILAEIIKIVT